MIATAKASPDYERFNSIDLNDYKVAHAFGRASPVFVPQNHGYWFTSIDLVKANWQSFSYAGPGVVKDSDSYEDWARLFTDEEYYLKSKQIRQVVFGSLSPKRQQVFQRYMMDQIWHRIDEAGFSVLGATSDEIVVPQVKFGEEEGVLSKLGVLVSALPLGYDLHVDTYYLEKISEDKPFYRRIYTDGSFDLKGVPAHYYAEVLQHVLGNEPTDMDRTSFFEGRVVRFLEPLF